MNDQENIEIKMNLKGKDKLLATFVAILHPTEFGPIEMKGFRIMSLKNSDDLWIEPPSYESPRNSRKYHKFLFFEEETWKRIKEKAAKEYKDLLESGEDVIVVAEDVNPDEVPL